MPAARPNSIPLGGHRLAGKYKALTAIVRSTTRARLHEAARFTFKGLADQRDTPIQQVKQLQCLVVAEAKRDRDIRALTTIPDIGANAAATVKARVPDSSGFRSDYDASTTSRPSGQGKSQAPVQRPEWGAELTQCTQITQAVCVVYLSLGA